MKPPRPLLSSALIHTTGHLRIIGGMWRGRKLSFPAIDGLRPTGDRVRETLFNWLAPEIQGAHCLDVFAGSGALGVEALSRGAEQVVMIERDSKAATQLRKNLDILHAQNVRVINGDAISLLEQGERQLGSLSQNNEQAPFHIIFIDSPFQLNLWQRVIDLLEAGNWLANNATIYIESGRETNFQPPVNWQLHREKYAGNVGYRLYYRESP